MNNLLNIPNILSILRILLSPFFLLLIIFPANLQIVIAVIALFVIASITDFLDGYIARKYKLITKIGQILDPVADKLMITFALLTFVYLNLIPIWIVVIILLRELSITIHRFYLLGKNRVAPATNSGKYKVTIQMLMIFLILISIAVSIGGNKERIVSTSFLKLAEQSAIWLALILSVLSGVEYFVKYISNSRKISSR